VGRPSRCLKTCASRTSTARRSSNPDDPLYVEETPQAVCAGIVRERLPKGAGHYREAGSGMREFLGLLSAGVGCSRGLAWAHNPKVAGSNPAPATKQIKGLAASRG